MLKIVYRISEPGPWNPSFIKIKPTYIDNKTCFLNAIKAFPVSKYQWHVIADSVSESTKNLLESNVPNECIEYVDFKRGAGYPFMKMLDIAIATYENSDIVYFVENDYIHRQGSDKVILEGINLGADYVTLYDHPDKYMNPEDGGNPYIEDRAEITKVYLSESCHWKLTNSTTGTFSATVRVLKRDYETIKKYANNVHWLDFQMFTELLQQGASLISPLPAYSTHGEVAWLAPLINWEEESKI
jgi:hypothetical protein